MKGKLEGRISDSPFDLTASYPLAAKSVELPFKVQLSWTQSRDRLSFKLF